MMGMNLPLFLRIDACSPFKTIIVSLDSALVRNPMNWLAKLPEMAVTFHCH
jgi:hypothetical protein